MSAEIEKALVVGAAIASSLVAAIVKLFQWIRSLVKRRNEQDAEQIKGLQTRLDQTIKELADERAARLRDARDYSNGVIALSHRFREAVVALTKWPKK